MENNCGRHVRREKRKVQEAEREGRVGLEDYEVDHLLLAYERGRRIANRAEQGPRVRDEATFRKFEVFARLKPPRFNGENGFKAAEEWLAAVKSRLEVCQTPLEHQVRWVTYYLEKSARFWWEGIKRGYEGDAAQIPWIWFEERFEQRFMGTVHKETMRTKFVTLKQQGRTVAEYNRQFLNLSQYAPDIFDDAYRQRRQYLDGLDPDVAIAVDSQANQGLQALMDAAEQVDVYKKRKVQQGRNQIRNVRGRGRSAAGPKHEVSTKQTLKSVQSNPPSKPNWCRRCKRPHPEAQCYYSTRTCFRCGSSDHWIKDCSKPAPTSVSKTTTIGASSSHENRILQQGYGYTRSDEHNTTTKY
ncbi:hypothetical protein LUZ61_010705 [Rhynchospora tenuis]|uniref:CCHC-type domain-containing protein n=1 Tax=Rhynchospora tenuis TaxID=198213 RepID=A0AAD5ZZQ4_9POAL|nr:hypothetical protein LUZ61_010705 [Rhynchospora tenuis]